MLYHASQVLCKQDGRGGGGRLRLEPRALRLASVALAALSFSCEAGAREAPSALPTGDGWTQIAGDSEGMLAASEHAVYALDGRAALRLAGAPQAGRLAVELATDGQHYGVYQPHGFELHDRTGNELATLAPARLGFRHKLIGGGHVIVPVLEERGPEEGRMVGIELRDASGALRATISAPDGVRFTRPSAGAITFAAERRIARHALDGRELWSLRLAAHELAVAAERDRVAVVSAEDTRRVLLLADGRQIAAADLREPIWNAALSASGEHAAVTTRHRLHAFAGGRLQLNLRLPLAYAVSLAVAGDGRMLVGGQDAGGRALVLCYARGGALLAQQALAPEQQAFKPAVRWLDPERYVALGSNGPVYGRCPREVAP
jgi:hypothetical protein